MPEEQPAAVESRDVGPLELFFDLVFVFAVSQLSQHLLTHLTWRGAAQTVVLLAAIFSVWAYASFEATTRDVERKGTQATLLGVMFLGLFMNASIGKAFSTNPWPFVVPFLLSQIGPGVVAAGTVAVPQLREHYRRMLVWYLCSGVLWVVGALVGTDQRLAWWVAAAAMDVAGTWLAHPLPGRTLRSQDLPFDGGHMIERLQLFLIIALGEAVLTTGTAISAARIGPLTVAAGVAGLAVVVALWAAYFGASERLVSGHIARTTNPIRSAHLGINGMYVVLAGLIAIAVGNELVIEHPDGHGDLTVALLLFGGALLFVGTQTWYLSRTADADVRSAGIACACLLAGGVVSVFVPRLPGLVLLLVVLAALTAHLLRRQRLRRPS